ncbi:hypothetical protein FGO68_gene9977 [Halteria grandinella]|uniref:Uncharacterized protein n=1 Tax=Halteria grandinella TaxID=5974 RepID=A0A8J8P4V8_HALGN|nr:hypothetical protein FGO68_gene9977 [Halteria grandinella]
MYSREWTPTHLNNYLIQLIFKPYIIKMLKVTSLLLKRPSPLKLTILRSFSTSVDPSLPISQQTLYTPTSNSITHSKPTSSDDDKDEIAQQRSMFEDSLKFAASSLSNKTDASKLVRLLRTTAFLDNQQIGTRLVEYLKTKISQVSNEELAQVYSSLVLLKQTDQKLIKILEYLTLRRVHSLPHKELTKILTSYGYLCIKGKTTVSSSFVKTFEYVVMNKMHDFTLNDLGQCLISLIRLQKMSATTTKVIANQTLLQIFDKWSYELEDDQRAIQIGILAEAYYQVMNQSALRKEVDPKVMENRIIKSGERLKAKDVFNIMHVTESKEIVEHLLKHIEIEGLIPEEIVIFNSMVKKHGVEGKIVPQIEAYIEKNMDDMETEEISKLYMSCLLNQLPLSPSFHLKLEEHLLLTCLPTANAHSLPYLLPVLSQSKLASKPTPAQIREIILKTLRQKDFSSQTFILTLGQTIDHLQANLSEDLEFWRQIIQYLPMLPNLDNIDQYCQLRSCIQHLDEKIEGLDFSGTLAYLEERYEKPYLAMIEERAKSRVIAGKQEVKVIDDKSKE